MKAVPYELTEAFWCQLDAPGRCALLRDMDVAPADGSLTFRQQRQGLLDVAKKRKVTKLRAALNALLPAPPRRGFYPRGPRAPAPVVSAEAQRAALALCAKVGLLREAGESWRPAAQSDNPGIHYPDAVVQAAVKRGWLQIFHFQSGHLMFKFVVVTSAGHAALGAET